MEKEWREYHARWSGRHWLDRAMEHWEFNRKFHRKLAAYLRPGDSLLDIGCGNGYSASYFAAHGHPVTGIDTDRAAVEEAGEWAERLSLPVRFVADDIFTYCAGERFRMSYSMGLIEHFPGDGAARMLAIQAELSEYVVAMAPTSHSLGTRSRRARSRGHRKPSRRCGAPLPKQGWRSSIPSARGKCGPDGKGRFTRRCRRWRCISSRTGSHTPWGSWSSAAAPVEPAAAVKGAVP